MSESKPAALDWIDEDKEAVQASYAETIDDLTRKLEERGVPTDKAVFCANGILAASLYKAANEGARRVRVLRGLPEHDQSHRSASEDGAQEVLLRHSGGQIDDQSLQDLLVDLIWWAGTEGFDASLEAAVERYEEEVEEDAEEAKDDEPSSQEDERQEARMAKLHAYQPAKYDA